MGQLTLTQRYRIEICLSKEMTQIEIGKEIGKDKSVISREISRSSDGRSGEYRAELAQRKADNRHANKNKKVHFTAGVEVYI